MFRFLGFCLGSFVSIAALILLIGVPNLKSEGTAVDQAHFDAAVEKLRAKQVSARIERPAPESAATGPEVSEAKRATGLEPETQPAQEAMTASGDQGPATNDAIPEPAAAIEAAEPEWHPFWTPFRSEVAARGFISRLENVTGLDYRVVKVKSGVYQVAFAYNDNSELDLRLAQISAATGLDVSDSLP